jgi:hypothetical protein
MGTLRGSRRQNRSQHLGSKLVRGSLDLSPGIRALRLKCSLRSLNPLLCRLPSCGQGSLPVGVQPLQALFPAPENLSPRRSQPGFVLLGSDIGLGHRKPGFFHCPRGPLPPLSAGFHQPVVEEEAIGQHQQNKQDQGRYGTERKITKLMQQFIHGLAGGGSRIDWEDQVELLVLTDAKIQCQMTKGTYGSACFSGSDPAWNNGGANSQK